MSELNFKREINANLDDAVERVTAALKEEGFGVLTRIDFHSKMKEKLGKDVQPTIILGACNPGLVYEAFLRNTDVTSLIPCNAVVREIAPGRVSIELAKPSFMMKMLGERELENLATVADAKLNAALQRL